MKRKPATSNVYLQFYTISLKHLIASEYARRFHTIFDGVSEALVPTNLSFDESRGGNPSITLDEIRSLDTWIPFSQKRWGTRKKVLTDGDMPYRLQGYVLEYKERVKGEMVLSLRGARPPERGRYSQATGGNGISFTLDLEPLMKQDILRDALRLFANVVRYVDSCHARVYLGVRTTAKWHYIDDPEYARVRPVEVNGVTIMPFEHVMTGGGPTMYCLPRFNPWINVLGKEYVELLGREKLLSLDVHSAREDEDGRVWLQIAEHPEQMHLPETKEHVKRLMESLDAPDVFCRDETCEPGKVEYRRPEFDWSDITGG